MTRGIRIALSFVIPVALLLHGVVLLLFLALALDMGPALLDNAVGVLTPRAIAAVMHAPAPGGDIAAAVRTRFGSVSWAAAHADDDCLYSVGVTAVVRPGQSWYEQAHWCVRFRSTGLGPFGRFVVAELVPGNDVAATLSPTLAARIPPPAGGPWACSTFYLQPIH